ncbi:DUF4190 domain-containing protein [Kineococcus terrestris]|uniref:DUF4190 domain-containing protein n=1 Tax=Kineococcus terrestris TaxID=2044856 RepID=UPI0034DB507D
MIDPRPAAPGAWPPPPSGTVLPATPPPRPTDGVSVGALVCSLLGVLGVPAVVLGGMGLARTAGGRRAGRGLAVAGLVLGGLQVLAGAVALVALALFASGQDAWETVLPASDEVQGAQDLRTGDCLDEEGSDVLGWDVVVRDCAGEHTAEVLALVDAQGAPGSPDDFPGDDALQVQADLACTAALAGALDGADATVGAADLVPDWYVPTADGWAAGDRTIDCLVVGLDADGWSVPLTGSLLAGTLASGPATTV